jgi:hypothetical protein
MQLTNWNRSADSNPHVVVHPKSVAELQNIVRTATHLPVRAAGELHSVNACFAANGGTQVLMDAFRGCEVLPPASITVGAGATLLDIRRALRPHGLELPVTPEIGNATAGSVACSGTKDSSLFERAPVNGDEPAVAPAFGQVGSAVTQVKMVDAEGRDLTLSGDALRDIRSSYGLRGIIYEVTFQVHQAIPLRYTHDLLTFENGLPTIAEIFGKAEGVLAFLEPFRPGLLVERRRRAPGAVIGHDDVLKRRIRDHLWEWGASEATTVLTTLGHVLDPLAHLKSFLPDDMGSLLDRVRDLKQAPHVSASDKLLQIFGLLTPEILRALQGFTAYRSDSNIDFTRDRVTFFDFTFWAYPVSQWRRVVTDFLVFCEAHRAKVRPALFTEVYFICADDRSRLAFAPQEHAFTLDMVHNEPNHPGWHALNEAYNEFAVTHGGRPLLNQTKRLPETPHVVGRALPDWAAFKKDVAGSPAGPRFLKGSFFDRFE